MERLSVTIMGTALGLILAAAGARAAPVEIAWTDHWAAVTPRLYAEGYRGGNNHYVTFATPNAVTMQSPSGKAIAVLAANLATISSASSSRPDRISADYTLSLMLTDEVSNAWTVRQFHGQLNGWFWRGGGTLSARFLPVNPQTFFLGRNFYAVAFGSLMKERGSTNLYALDAYVAAIPTWQRVPRAAAVVAPVVVSPLDDAAPAAAPGAPPQASPEPCTLLLAALGAAGLGGRALWQWRRTRRAVPPALA
jgi:hypothetical protein